MDPRISEGYPEAHSPTCLPGTRSTGNNNMDQACGQTSRVQERNWKLESAAISSVYVDLNCTSPAPASNRVNLLHGSHRCTHTPSRHQILQAARAWLRNNSAITAKVDISCARADACSTDDCTPLAASVIACAARLRQNRCNETHQNKSAPPPRPSVTPKPLRRSQK